MNPSTTFRSTTQRAIWLLVFISSVSAVTTLRRQLTAGRPVAAVMQSVSVKLIHTTARTHLLLP